MYPRNGFLCMDGWEGRTEQLVSVVRETPKRYWIKNTDVKAVRLPRGRWLEPGQVTAVPKRAISFV